MAFTKAVKKQAKLRLGLESPSGYGKTYTALQVATQLVEGTGKRIAGLDTEGRGQGSMAKYSHLFDFDVDEIVPPFHPDRMIQSLSDAIEGDYGVWICDSWSHFWQGRGGMLDIVKQIAREKYRGDTHRAWGDDAVTNIEQGVLDAILGAPLHVIVCMRMKTDTVREESTDGEKTKTRIRKAGLKAIQRDGFDYEFDIVGQFETPTIMTVAKTRIETLQPDSFIEKPAFLVGTGSNDNGRAFVPKLKAWLEDGVANESLERPAPADKRKLEKVIAELNKTDGERDWAEIADKYARREFSHGVGALTKTELAATVTAMGTHLESLIAAAASGANDETAPTPVPEGAAA